MKVKDVMTQDPITIDPEAPLGTAMEVMRDRHVRHLPVVDDTGRLIGILTDRDVRQAAFAPALAERLSLRAQRRLRALGAVMEELCVRDGMTWVVVTTHPEATLSHAALVMFERRVGCLPVVKDERLVGILTEHDLLKALAKEFPTMHIAAEGFLW